MVSAFTPLVGASLLHVAAEYGNANVARVLIEMGADVNAKASIDEYGLNGHTPLFHTYSRPEALDGCKERAELAFMMTASVFMFTALAVSREFPVHGQLVGRTKAVDRFSKHTNDA